jgi:hypothetical protein
LGGIWMEVCPPFGCSGLDNLLVLVTLRDTLQSFLPCDKRRVGVYWILEFSLLWHEKHDIHTQTNTRTHTHTRAIRSILQTSPISTNSISRYPTNTMLSALKYVGSFLIDPTFWSRIGFLISYIATSLIAVEVLRLVCTDVNKRDVEKFLESYSKQRAASPPRGRSPPGKTMSMNIEELATRPRSVGEKRISVNIEELERSVTPSPPAVGAPQVQVRAVRTPEEKMERRRRATSSASQQHQHAQRTASPTPVRKLRKRSDTLTSTGSSESKRPSSRRHRESSPSEASERHASPRPRSREEKERRSGLGLGLGLGRRAKV